MKVFINLLIISGSLAGPTGVPERDLMCPTECADLEQFGSILERGPRPDFDAECDVSILEKKCNGLESDTEVLECPKLCSDLVNTDDALYDHCDLEKLVKWCQDDNGRDFPDDIYDFSELLLEKFSDERVCSAFPDVCCPLMVARNEWRSEVFTTQTLALLSDEAARETCAAGGNKVCCVTGDLCQAYPDLPNCQFLDELDKLDKLEAESSTVRLESEPTTMEPTTALVDETQDDVDFAAGFGIGTENSQTDPVTERTESPLSEKIVAGPDDSAYADGDNKLEDEEDANSEEQSGMSKLWVVLAVLLGIGLLGNNQSLIKLKIIKLKIIIFKLISIFLINLKISVFKLLTAKLLKLRQWCLQRNSHQVADIRMGNWWPAKRKVPTTSNNKTNNNLERQQLHTHC